MMLLPVQAVEAANTLLKEKNKDRVKSHYTTVMQKLEESYNVLFLLNGSLPDDGGKRKGELLVDEKKVYFSANEIILLS